jgi:hypothetical protein
MEYLIEMSPGAADVPAIAAALRAVDPASLADFDARRLMLRVAATLDPVELLEVLGDAGCPVDAHRIHPQPSVCCGGCGG